MVSNPSETSRNYHVQRSICALIAILIGLASIARGDADDERLLAGLRDRRLFRLAEEFCRERLATPGIGEVERVDYLVELITTLGLHAIHAPAAERNRLWRQVEEEVKAARRRQPASPRQILIDVQGALASLSRAEFARQELESLAPAPEALAAAQNDLRQAIKQLQALREEAARLLRLRNRQPAADPAELTANEFLGVQQNLHYQLGRAWRSLAESFPPGSADRISCLQQAIAELKPLADSANEHPLAWQARLDDVACRRLLKDRLTSDRLTALRGDHPPPRIQVAALAEAIRLAIGSGDLELADKWAEEGSKVPVDSPTFDFARLELQIAKAEAAIKQNNNSAAQAAQDSAARIAAAIAARHGPLWGRRAQTLLASIAASGGLANIEVLAASAAQHLRLGRLPEAIAAYDQAAAQAKARGQSDRSFSFGWAAASIAYQQQDWSASQRRFLTLAASFPRHAQAAEAHWNGATSAALAARAKSAPRLDDYILLLEAHIEHWPANPTADKARWWLGQARQNQRRWKEGAEAFRSISANFADYPLAIRRWGECAEQHLAEEKAGGKPIGNAPAKVVEEMEARYVSVDGKLPTKWDAAQAEALIAAARLRLKWLPNSADESARQLAAYVSASGDSPAAPVARRWLVAALAASGTGDEAKRLIESLPHVTLADCLTLERQLGATSREAAPAARKTLGEIRLVILARIKPGFMTLSQTDQLVVRESEIESLLDAGRQAEGIAAMEALAKSHPDDGAFQQRLAELWEAAGDAASLEKGLFQWRTVLSRSPLRSERSYRASLGVATCLYRLGRKGEARQAIELLMARPPGLEKTSLKNEFLEVLRKSGQ